MDVLLTDTAHAPDPRCHLLSLPMLIKNGNVFDGRTTVVVVRLKSEPLTVIPLSGALFSLDGYRGDNSNGEHICAVLAPGKPPEKKSTISINNFHRTAGHSHEGLLRKPAEQRRGRTAAVQGVPYG